jgi:hypothetical protein
MRSRDGYLQPITHVAILDQHGNPVALPAPNRHHHIIRKMASDGHPTPIVGEQGFLLEDGTFVHRIPAGQIALKTGQIEALAHPPHLYSEDLW